LVNFHRSWHGEATALACLFLFGLAACSQLRSEPPGEDWPRFLGPRADNISRETGLLEKWPTNGPPMLWDKPVGTGYSAPSVRGVLLVLHHRQGHEEIVEAFIASTGKSVWRHAYPSAFVDPFGYNNGPRCTPLLTSNRCYTFGAEGKLLCLNRSLQGAFGSQGVGQVVVFLWPGVRFDRVVFSDGSLQWQKSIRFPFW